LKGVDFNCGGFVLVEIVCSPPKRLTILECTQYPSLDALSKTIATVIMMGQPVALKWAEGVAFSYSILEPTSDVLMKEFMEGRIYWSDVLFAPMSEYQPTVRVGTLDVPVIDVTPNPILREAAKWMKARAQKRT